MQQPISLVITDFDNTLYDWVEMWYQAFSSMLNILVANSGVEKKILEQEIRTIFQKYHTSEYAFVIGELPSLQALNPDEDLAVKYESAINAYRKAREATLKLYPTVYETLQFLKATNCLVVVYTESRAFYSAQRIKRLNLDGVVDYLYSPPDHDIPDYITPQNLRPFPADYYTLFHTKHRFTPEGEYKPNSHILRYIIQELGGDRQHAIYIGDNLIKDIKMAQDAGVIDVYAAYGKAQHTEAYKLLRRVSHWTDEDINREKRFYDSRAVTPTFRLEKRFSEILNIFRFVSH